LSAWKSFWYQNNFHHVVLDVVLPDFVKFFCNNIYTRLVNKIIRIINLSYFNIFIKHIKIELTIWNHKYLLIRFKDIISEKIIFLVAMIFSSNKVIISWFNIKYSHPIILFLAAKILFDLNFPICKLRALFNIVFHYDPNNHSYQ
jgi:hypothetical protein